MSAVELGLEQLVTPALLVMELILWVGKLHLIANITFSLSGSVRKIIILMKLNTNLPLQSMWGGNLLHISLFRFNLSRVRQEVLRRTNMPTFPT
jgi:hypothetical protein